MDTHGTPAADTQDNPLATLLANGTQIVGVNPDTFDPAIRSYVIRRVTDLDGDECLISVSPMIFNDRIILTSLAEYPRTWTAAWCYDKGGAAVLAANAWNFPEQDSPVGWTRIAADNRHP